MRRRTLLAGLGGVVLLPSRPRAQGVIDDPNDEAGLYQAARREGMLVWYGGAPMAQMQRMAGQFRQKYPGIKVDIQRFVGVEQYQRFMRETEAKQYIVDILHVGDEPSMGDLVDRNYVVDWKVPSYDRVPPDARIKVSAYTSYLIDGAIAYNSTRVSPEEVEILKSSWRGITDPRFKGRIATSTQKAGGTLALIQMFMESKYKNQYGIDYLKAVAAQKLALYTDAAIPVDRIAAGEQDIFFTTGEGTVYVAYLNGAPIRWVHPKPTPAYGSTWFGISAFAPHPNAARLFLNWMMSDDGAQAVLTQYGGMPLLRGVADTRPVTRQPWYDPITERYVPDWQEWVRSADRDMDSWIKLLKAAQ